MKWTVDSYRISVLTIRLLTGVATCLLSLVDIGQSNKILELFFNGTALSLRLSGATVWSLASRSLLWGRLIFCDRITTLILITIRIPIFSTIIFCEQLAEFVRLSNCRSDMIHSLVLWLTSQITIFILRKRACSISENCKRATTPILPSFDPYQRIE